MLYGSCSWFYRSDCKKIETDNNEHDVVKSKLSNNFELESERERERDKLSAPITMLNKKVAAAAFAFLTKLN